MDRFPTIKRNRSPNFKPAERVLLVKLMREYDSVVTDPNLTKNQRLATWTRISRFFAKRMKTRHFRDTAMLRTCWDNIKRKARTDKMNVFSEAFQRKLLGEPLGMTKHKMAAVHV